MIDVAHHRDDWWPGHFNLADILIAHEVLEGFVGHLVLKGDDLGVGSELRSHILHQLSVERLVDGDKNAAHQKRCDQVFAAYTQLFGQIFYADAFCHRNGAGDRHRLLGNLRSAETRRGRKALHWAFLGLGILLPSATLLRSGSLRPRSLAGRRCEAAGTTGTGPGGAKSRASTETGPGGAETRTSAGAGSSPGLGTGGVHGPARTAGSVLWTG